MNDTATKKMDSEERLTLLSKELEDATNHFLSKMAELEKLLVLVEE